MRSKATTPSCLVGTHPGYSWWPQAEPSPRGPAGQQSTSCTAAREPTAWWSSVAALCRSTRASRRAGCSTARQPGGIPAGDRGVWHCDRRAPTDRMAHDGAGGTSQPDRVTCGQRDAVAAVRAPVDGALSSHSAPPRGDPRSRGAARHGGAPCGSSRSRCRALSRSSTRRCSPATGTADEVVPGSRERPWRLPRCAAARATSPERPSTFGFSAMEVSARYITRRGAIFP